MLIPFHSASPADVMTYSGVSACHIALRISVRMLQTVKRPLQKLNANDAYNQLYIEIEIIHKLM